MIVLASNFSGMALLILIVPIAGILGAVSFYPAWRGHWAAPLLAAPLLIVGGFAAFLSLVGAELPLAAYLLLLLPLVVSLSSIGLWIARMRVRSAGPRGGA